MAFAIREICQTNCRSLSFLFFFCYQVIVSEGHFTQRYLVLGDRLLPGRSGWPTKFDIFSY